MNRNGMTVRHACWAGGTLSVAFALSACSGPSRVATDAHTRPPGSTAALEALYQARRGSARMERML